MSPGRLLRGIDVSNYQPPDLAGLIRQYQAEHVVVRLSTESRQHRGIATAQLCSALDRGCTVSGYVWCYWDADPRQHVADALDVLTEAGLGPREVGVIWLDVEDTESLPLARCSVDEWLREAVATVEAAGYRPGIYTGQWFWQTRVRGDFSWLPLWAAQYDGIPTLESVTLFGGWNQEMLWGKQYSADEIDLDVFSELVIPCGGGL